VGQVSQVPTNAIVIAVDGGGSKTDGVALDLDGNIIAQARKGRSSANVKDYGPAVRIIDSLITEIHAATGGRPILATNIYLAGLDFPTEIATFEKAVAEKAWAVGVTGKDVIVDNDMHALLRAGTQEPNAVAVICGTGINCIGVREDGVDVRFPAIGMISGDWGGGWSLGEQALWYAARAFDGRGVATSFTTSIPELLGLPDVGAVIEAFHFGRLKSSVLPSLAPLVLAASDAGDAIANAIVDRQAEEIVTFAVAALKRLELLEESVPIVLGGGVVATGNARLISGIESRLAQRAPMARVELVRSPPILGAALLTLESVGSGPAALDTARLALLTR